MKALYEKFIVKPLGLIDSGDVFKKGFFFIFKLLAIAIWVVGIVNIIMALGSYFKFYGQMDAFLVVRSIIVFIVTFVLSLAAYAVMGFIFWKSGDDFKSNEYNGIALIASKFIKIVGQLSAVILIVLGLNNFFPPFLWVYHLHL
ncbi:MAG: hypothetical protein JXJ04_27035 [Spirochaetales bacterium]|nr:hypothetical protein [Spirochaetales bacterium]